MQFNSEKIIYYKVPGGTLLYTLNDEFEALKTFINKQNLFKVYCGLDSVMIFHDSSVTIEDLKKFLNEMTSPMHDITDETIAYTIPIYYDLDGRDWSFLEKTLLSPREEIIASHQNSIHQLEMYGFLPGFPYIKNKSISWQIPRKSIPDKKVPEGSVGLADNFTGIYPVESPAGWHIIGYCPIRFLNVSNDNPILYNVGCQLRFESISKSKYHQLL